ncbi:MAG: hypothetical protein COB73_00790 [Flavobacteriaceae bacterium]|nr:MAG: hypothetical protein COB73_00790 [Flavobacteriaceae bacterium]
MKNLSRIVVALIAVFAVGILQSDASVELVGNSLDSYAPTMAFAAVAKKELAEKELINHFRHEGTWLSRVPSKNQWVGNDVIKLNEIGADPTVLIDNNTYPIAVSQRTDTSTAISLFKYDTENTKVTDDEAYALPYDKSGTVQRQHRETLEEETQAHALHSIAPAANTADTPILQTSGAAIGGAGTRLRLTYKDLVDFKQKLDALKIPKKGRVLVLCPDHIADLLLEDKALNVQYNNHTTGAIAKNYVGFEIFEDINAPEYTVGLTKIAYGGAAGTAASVFFLANRTAKARGTVTRYLSKASDDPQNRETVIGFRLYFIAIPTSLKGQGAIVSGVSA